MERMRRVTLDNGLEVILKEVHAAPIISTWLWYRVGSRNELGGDTGISHWVEHMLFKGSARFPKGEIMRAVDRLGGYINAMTSHDFTVFYTTLPSAHAELALEIEADRMASAEFAPAEVEAERTVIIAEREGGENEPSYMLAEEVCASAFRVHPYHHQTIGWKEDLLRLTRDHLYAHYRRYYLPNNAILVVVGDFDTEDWLKRIAKAFEPIPPGDMPPQDVPQEPPQRGERRVILRMPGAAPIVRIAYHTPPVSHADFVPLAIADAILSGGRAIFAFGDSQARSARLYRALVETELASSAGSHYHASLDPYLMTLGATVHQGRTPAEVEAALLAEVQRLQEALVEPRELHMAIRQTQAQFAYANESVSGQALSLGFLAILDRPERMDTLFEELAAVTPEDVQRVARTYFTEENRTVGWFVPSEEGAASEAQPSEASRWAPWRQGVCFYRTPKGGIGPESIFRAELDNGAVVLVHEKHDSATLVIGGQIRAGSYFDPSGQEGLAGFVAAMLRRGTAQRTFQEINLALDAVGASLEISAGRNDVGFGGHALAEDADLLISLLGEMLMAPSFPDEEVRKLRGQIITRLAMLEMDTGYRSDRAFMEALYPPGHPYGRDALGKAETIAALSREDLVQFYQRIYHPRTMVLSVVGAVEAERIVDRLNATLGQWRPANEPPAWAPPVAQTPPEVVVRRVHIPGRPQVDLVLGVVGMPRTSPDYYPAAMANIILGRLGMMGRLGRAVRDEQGLAYYITSILQAGQGTRPWSIEAGVQPDHIDRTVSAILEEIARMREELVSDQEFADCKSYLIGALPLQLETNEGIGDLLINIEQYGLGLDYLQRYNALIEAVSREAIREVVAKYFAPGRYVLAMAGSLADGE